MPGGLLLYFFFTLSSRKFWFSKN